MLTHAELPVVDSNTPMNAAYSYDDSGLRINKTVDLNGLYAEYEYIWDGDLLLGYNIDVNDGENTYAMRIFYNDKGESIGYTYRDGNNAGDTIWYIKNVFGDIQGLYSINNARLEVLYTYDAWGNPSMRQAFETTNTSDEELALTYLITNQLTYRGYYYDFETGLYYLQSRYYSPTWRRFLNADQHFDTGSSILGTNMYIYCDNNPIAFVDPSGEAIKNGADANIPNGNIYFLKSNRNVTNKLYLDVASTGRAIGLIKNGGRTQQWKILKISSGIYELAPMYDTGVRLDVPGAQNKNGLQLQVYKSNGTAAQRWKILSNGNGTNRLMPQCASSRCLDMNPDKKAITYTWWSGANQKWTFEQVPATDIIKNIQKQLNIYGYYDSAGKKLAEDGKIGDKTKDAIGEFQIKNKLTGNKNYNDNPMQLILFNSADAIRNVRAVQQRLKDLGYKDSSGKDLVVDNKTGPNTKHAIKQFTINNGLTQTENWDNRAMQSKLFSGSAKRAPASGGTTTNGQGTRSQYEAMNLAYPVDKKFRTINSPIGWRNNNTDWHAGIDIGKYKDGVAVSDSTKIDLIAVDNGKIENNKYQKSGAGYYITIKLDSVDPGTGKNIQATYMHLNVVSPLAEGTRVTKGSTVVGNMGATGGDYSRHLHIQFSCNGGMGNKAAEYRPYMINPAWFWAGMSYLDNTARGYTNAKFLEVLYADTRKN